jgi:hypothetical protein
MPRLITALVAAALGLGAGGHEVAQEVRQFTLWQADLQIRSLTVSEEKGSLRARVVVGVEVGEALGARIEVMLPVGVGIVTLGPGCLPGPNVTGIRELRARVECSVGTMSPRSTREVFVVTTVPPNGVSRGFAVMAMSDTPDPKPGNNFAERVIPPDD